MKITFGSVTIETSARPSGNPSDRLECEISLTGDNKSSMWLRGREVEDFMQCMQALARLKRMESDP